MKKVFVLVAVLLMPLQVMGREVKTTIGKWGSYSGSIQFSIEENDGKKRASIFVSDEHNMHTNFFFVTKSDLLKIKALIDETLAEL